ncbi:MAG: xylulokinase, partial [Clostridia bacterium]|nr:xylulokinase [Clostridia bacterium]
PSFGGAILAAVGCGEYDSVEEAAESIVKVKDRIEPNAEIAAKYESKYRIFKRLYPSLKDIYSEM